MNLSDKSFRCSIDRCWSPILAITSCALPGAGEGCGGSPRPCPGLRACREARLGGATRPPASGLSRLADISVEFQVPRTGAKSRARARIRRDEPTLTNTTGASGFRLPAPGSRLPDGRPALSPERRARLGASADRARRCHRPHRGLYRPEKQTRPLSRCATPLRESEARCTRCHPSAAGSRRRSTPRAAATESRRVQARQQIDCACRLLLARSPGTAQFRPPRWARAAVQCQQASGSRVAHAPPPPRLERPWPIDLALH
jgi:hypothetical protein|eukprot:COSAG06_NODE_7229_length_2578_cov_44.797902_4_plen_259_part_00